MASSATMTSDASAVATRSTATLRSSRTPIPTRSTRTLSTDSGAASSSYSDTNQSLLLRTLRHSNHDEPTTRSATGPVSSGPPARRRTVQSQPILQRNYPGTPGRTRSVGRPPLESTPLLRSLTKPTTQTFGNAATSLTASPTRRLNGPMTAAAAAHAALPADDVLCRIFGSCLPAMFEALAKFQYHQATSVLDSFDAQIANEEDGTAADWRREWKSWDVFVVMIRLASSCESAYHLMQYLEPDMIHTETLEQLYNKLVVLLNHLVDDLQPVFQRAQQRINRAKRPTVTKATQAPSSTGSSVQSVTSDEALTSELDRLTLDDLEHYHSLLNQAAQFFLLRISMLGLYRGLATQPPPHKYSMMTKTLERLSKRYAQFDHPLLAVLKQSAIEELRTVRAAFESEICMAQYDFTKSMVALHRFKNSLRLWSDHIDSVSDYPLYDESDDDEDYLFSSSVYSNTNSIGSSTLQIQQQLAAGAISSDSLYSSGDGAVPSTIGSLPRRQSSFRRSPKLASAYVAASEQAVAAAAATATTPTAPETQNAFSRLISQRGSLLKRGLSVASLQSKIQAATTSQPPTTPPNALEHAILGSTPSVVNGIGIPTSTLTPNGNGLGSVGTSGTSGFNTTNTHTLAAEMMASAVAKQEREDGYALPVYQWSKRFYRSLVAKFTLYFHRWLESFESRGDALSPYDLTRFIRSPVGISYLQLIDVLLAKGSHRVEDGTASVVLILETEKLDNKGAKFYTNGYFCPGYSHNDPKPTTDSAKTVKKLGYGAKAAGTHRATLSNRPAPSSAASTAEMTLSPSTSSSSSQSHSLFNLNVDPEAEDEDNGDFAPLWGLRGWPAVFCYPQQEPPLQHWPNIVSLIMDNRYALEVQGGRGPIVHTERRLKTSYYITSIDPAVFLVLLLEGRRRPSEKTTQDFMQTMTENLQHIGVFQRGGSVVASNKS